MRSFESAYHPQKSEEVQSGHRGMRAGYQYHADHPTDPDRRQRQPPAAAHPTTVAASDQTGCREPRIATPSVKGMQAKMGGSMGPHKGSSRSNTRAATGVGRPARRGGPATAADTGATPPTSADTARVAVVFIDTLAVTFGGAREPTRVLPFSFQSGQNPGCPPNIGGIDDLTEHEVRHVGAR